MHAWMYVCMYVRNKYTYITNIHTYIHTYMHIRICSICISIVARCQCVMGFLPRGLVFKPVLMNVYVPTSANSKMEWTLKRLSRFRAIAAAGLHIEGDNPCELLVRHLSIVDGWMPTIPALQRRALKTPPTR